MLTPFVEKKLLKRLRFLSLLLLVFGTSFFTYSFFYEPSLPLEIETAGPELTDLKSAPPTEQMLFMSGFIFYAIGLSAFAFALYKLKRHPHN